MTAAWSDMLDANAAQLRTDHGLAQAAAATTAWAGNQHRFGVSWHQGHREGWWAAVEWLLHAQTGWEAATEYEAILELRKGSGSIYYPLFYTDPTVWIQCPEDGRTVVDREGLCRECGWEVTA